MKMEQRFLNNMQGIECRIQAVVDEVNRIINESGDPVNFNVEAWVSDWLELRIPALGWKKPIDFLETEEGLSIVLNMLRRMQSGSYL